MLSAKGSGSFVLKPPFTQKNTPRPLPPQQRLREYNLSYTTIKTNGHLLPVSKRMMFIQPLHC